MNEVARAGGDCSGGAGIDRAGPGEAGGSGLRPCPFCGGAVILENFGAIYCDACGIEFGFYMRRMGIDKMKAIWNRRAND